MFLKPRLWTTRQEFQATGLKNNKTFKNERKKVVNIKGEKKRENASTQKQSFFSQLTLSHSISTERTAIISDTMQLHFSTKQQNKIINVYN